MLALPDFGQQVRKSSIVLIINMPKPKTNNTSIQDYDSRWFIWTIIFLVAAGISLTSYIVISGQAEDVPGSVPTRIISNR